MKSIGVVGAGVIGLATADALLEDIPDISITVYSSEFSPNTTGDVSAGWIYPYLPGDENGENLADWTNCTISHLARVAEEDNDVATALSPISGYLLYKNGSPKISQYENACFPDRRIVDQEEIARMTKKKYAWGLFITTWSCDCSTYLPYVMKKLEAKGVNFIKEKIHSLADVAKKGHDIVVNCAGSNAGGLAGDSSTFPIRGQVIVVRAPWIKHFFSEEDGDSYILPKRDTIVVGGTHTQDDSVAVDLETSKIIWADACEMYSRLNKAAILGHAAGLRPGRTKIRMEVEVSRTTNGEEYVVLHHYGHGGSGVTLHWGCAKQASAILKQFLIKTRSKL